MAKEELVLEEKRELQYTLQELALNIERQDAQIRHLVRTVAELGMFILLYCVILPKRTPKDETIFSSFKPIAESRSWLPKLPKIRSKNEDVESVDTQSTKPTTGNLSSNSGLLFKSLDLIENEIFYSDDTDNSKEGYRIIHEALAYLKIN